MNMMETLQAARIGCEKLGLRPEDFRAMGQIGQQRVIAVGLDAMKREAEEENSS